MKKVIIVLPCDLPVPSVSGGAVATLVESIVKQNEINHSLDLTIVSNYHVEACRLSRKYVNTKFIWFRYNGLLESIEKKLNKHLYLKKLFIIRFVRKILKTNSYDAVVLQNSGFLLKVFDDDNLLSEYQGKIFYHLHNDIPDNISTTILKKVKILIISNYLKKKLFDRCGNSIEKNCIILKNGINQSSFYRSLSENELCGLRNFYHIDTTSKIIIYVGRIKREKGVEELIKAFLKLNDSKYKLLIVGSTNFGSSDLSEFESYIQKLAFEHSDKIICTGYVPNSDLWKLYKLSSISILPSLWEEPAGLTMVESAASGLPLITTKSGGIPEYINSDYSIILDRDSQLVDNIVKSVRYIDCNSDLWYDLVNKQKQWVSKFSEENMFNDFVLSLEK